MIATLALMVIALMGRVLLLAIAIPDTKEASVTLISTSVILALARTKEHA